MSKLEKVRDRARQLEGRDPKGAIEAWLEVLKGQENDGEPNPDLSIYNRIGDLYLKIKDPGQAADYYDRAVDRYAELGFHNNAIAMCNKVLRNAPGRPSTYLKLAKLYASKGFIAEAKQNFVEYAERMKKAGHLESAFAALKQVSDLSPESEDLRAMLEEHLKIYGEIEHRPSRASVAAPPLEPKTPKRKTSSLVFLDLDEPPSPKGQGPAATAPVAPAAPPARPRATPPHAHPPAPAPPTAPPPKTPPLRAAPAAGLEIEKTSLTEEVKAAGKAGGTLDGLETTAMDFSEVRRSAADIPRLRDEELPGVVEAVSGLEPTAADDEAPPEAVAPVIDLEAEEVDEPPPAPEPPPKRKTVVEVPPLDLEPDFAVGEQADAVLEVDDQPLAEDEDVLAGWITREDDTKAGPLAGRSQGFIDLGLDGVVNAEEAPDVLILSGFEEPAAVSPPSIAELEARVADNPDDPDAHRTLAEALVEAGERDRGIEELDLAAAGYEVAGELQRAQDLLDEVLRLDPNSVRHRQKAVEYAYKAGEKARLIDAYLELADTLLRGNLPEKARAVYARVAEHDPGNTRAAAALNMLAPPAAAAPEGRVSPKDAKMRVRDDAAADVGDFVDLAALVLEEDAGGRDTRMKVEDEAPSGDEQRDFQDMLARFRQGIDENIDETDFQSHYDLGVAFKEMGLLDEAITEFQKALRSPEGKLRTSEALGACFFDKGALSVAESILRRGLELPTGDEKERLGVLYWLGRALEGQGKTAEARGLYERVCAVDIRFMDVGERVRALARA